MDKRTLEPSATSGPAPTAQQWNFATILLVMALFGILAGAVWYATHAWMSIEGPPMPASGYIFMTLGVVLSLLVGFGLMGLLFYSSRYGYDDQVGDERPRVSSAPDEDRRD